MNLYILVFLYTLTILFLRKKYISIVIGKDRRYTRIFLVFDTLVYFLISCILLTFI